MKMRTDKMKLLRNIEIFFILLNKWEKSVFRMEFFASLMNTGIITIERDLNYLRSRGISAHSGKNSGIEIFGNPPEAVKNEFLCIYSGLNFNLLMLLSKSCTPAKIHKLVILDIAIRNRIGLKIKTGNEIIGYLPSEIIWTDFWYVAGKNCGAEKILKIGDTAELKFTCDLF